MSSDRSPARFVLRRDAFEQGAPIRPAVDLSIVIPAYDEAARLPALFQSLRTHVDHARTEIIVVDDGSADDTVAVAKQHGDFAAVLRVIRHPRNRGKGAAVRTGMLDASAPLVAFLDADDATDLGALEAMCSAVEGRVGAVFGSRHAAGSVVMGSPPIRGLMGRVFNHVVRHAAGTSILDTQCGAKVFRTSAARAAFSVASVDGFAFDVEILRRLMELGVEVVEYPVRWRYVAGSKIRALTPLRMLRDIARIRFGSPAAGLHRIPFRYGDEIHEIAEPLIDQVTWPGEVCELLVDEQTVAPAEVEDWLSSAGLQSRS